MTLEPGRIETSIRLLQNGKYTWVITLNQPLEEGTGVAEILRMIDGQLRDKFPNHVQVSSVKFKELEDGLSFF